MKDFNDSISILTTLSIPNISIKENTVFQKQGTSSNSPDTIFLSTLRKKKGRKNHKQTFKTNTHTSANQPNKANPLKTTN